MGSFSLLYAISYVIFSFSYFSTLTLNSNDKQGVKFILIFVIMWIGSLIITLNSQFLGANVSIFQSMCLLGYCDLSGVSLGIITCTNLSLIFFKSLIIVSE